MPHAAVIFDVDGPLLELTPQEEDTFFSPLKGSFELTDLSRDWDSYTIRNDVEIYREILTQHLSADALPKALDQIMRSYVSRLESGYASNTLEVIAIPGARELLHRLNGIEGLSLGIATANLGAAARIRLSQVGMWDYVKSYPGAAEAGGAKSNILANVLAQLDLPPSRVVFLGDNLNDLEAGIQNNVHFIGFHTDAARRERLRNAGAEIVCGDHETTFNLISKMLDLR